jgi:hypothetical protein
LLELAAKYPGVVFVKVDVDALEAGPLWANSQAEHGTKKQNVL